MASSRTVPKAVLPVDSGLHRRFRTWWESCWGIVGAVGVGFFIYGAYMYLTASGAPNQMERGKSAMMTALAGIVLAMVAYGVVELVMNAVVNPGVEIDSVPKPDAAPDSSSGE